MVPPLAASPPRLALFTAIGAPAVGIQSSTAPRALQLVARQ
jgi:hypothetical protein